MMEGLRLFLGATASLSRSKSVMQLTHRVSKQVPIERMSKPLVQR